VTEEPAILARIREALEAALPPRDAASVLLAALSRFGPRVPSDVRELTAFAEGPLVEALRQRVDASRTRKILRAVEEIVATAAAPTRPHERPPSREGSVSTPGWRDESTAAVPVSLDAVPTSIVAATPSFGARLRAALGDRVEVLPGATLPQIEEGIRRGALVVVIDASDVPPLRPEELVAALAPAPATTLRAVWGSDLAYGRRFAELSDASGRPCAGVRLGDGMEAILDLVLSRRQR
jgi:hypothetical protein